MLTRLGLISERDLAESFSDFLKLPLVVTQDFPEAPLLEERLARKFLKESQIIPLDDQVDALVVAMVDPLDGDALDALRFAMGKSIHICVAYPSDFEAAWERIYGEGKSEITQIIEGAEAQREDATSDDVERLKDVASEAPVIRLVNLLISRAVEARASDIHIEPMDGELRIGYRVDGVLQEVESPPQRLSSAVISRVKIMAKLNIVERRLVQDNCATALSHLTK